MRKTWAVMLGIMGMMCAAVPAFAEGLDTLEQALKGGKVSGSVGNYMEYVDKDAIDSNYGWGTVYLGLNYKTAEWNRLTVGAGFFAHGEVYNEADNPALDPFTVDIEKEYTLPELYLTYRLMEKSGVTVGRFDHQKISHIDDNQSEGAYLSYKEIENLELVAGVMRRFAEIDYDDGEDFGRNTNQQDLGDKATFGADSKPYMLFSEAKYKALGVLTLNPYVMHQQGYASVFGGDADLGLKAGSIGYGSKFYYYFVDSKQLTSENAVAYAVEPYVTVGPVDAMAGYAEFSDGDAFNRPTWLRDYFLPLDQLAGYGAGAAGLKGSEVYFGKIKYTLGKFWTHMAMGIYSQDFNAAIGDGIRESEVQFGYNLTKNLSVNLRLFDVKYDHVDNKDYQKVESHVVCKF